VNKPYHFIPRMNPLQGLDRTKTIKIMNTMGILAAEKRPANIGQITRLINSVIWLSEYKIIGRETIKRHILALEHQKLVKVSFRKAERGYNISYYELTQDGLDITRKEDWTKLNFKTNKR